MNHGELISECERRAAAYEAGRTIISPNPDTADYATMQGHELLVEGMSKDAVFFRALALALKDEAPSASELAKHWLYWMECKHDEHRDVAHCACDWLSEPQESIGAAATRWAEHAVAQSGRRTP